jgi:type IV pilus assembly protein PilW
MNQHGYNYSRGAMAARGFTLIELMVAITLGILVSVGLVTVFDAVSTNNKVQQQMAEMQENGRYAITRINDDLRLAYRQLANTTGYSGIQTPGTNGAVNLGVAPDVYAAAGIPFPDGTVTAPTGWKNTTSHWPLSPSYFITGTVPSYLPAVSTNTDQRRVQGADVITMRYLNSEGWSSYNNEVRFDCTGAFLNSVIVTPVTTPVAYKSPLANFATGSLALLTSTSGDESIFPVTVAGTSASQTLTPLTASMLHAADKVRCPGSGEVKLFNFTTDFITVTYWLKLVADPQVTSPARFIPTLVRTQWDNSGVAVPATAHLELVQGVEQMDFLYGVQRANGKVEYVPAATVTSDSSSANCPAPPLSFSDSNFFTSPPRYETGCLWRAVKSVEAHILVDSVNDLFTLGKDEWNYRYNGATTPTAPASTTALMPSGLKAGSMMRREFITLVSVRNYNN